MYDDKPNVVTVKDAAGFKHMREFFELLLSRDDELSMMPYDDPKKATVGYLVTVADPTMDDADIAFEVAFAARPGLYHVTREGPSFSDDDYKLMDDLRISVDDFDFDKVLAKCLEDEDMIRVDDPKSLRIGFARYGSRFSSINYFKLSDLKASPPDLQEAVHEWRKKRPDDEYGQLAAKMLGQEV